MAETMRQLLEQHAWDGEYYLAAIHDNGTKIGSHWNTYGRLYLNSQSWAVMAGLKHGREALEMAEPRLDSDLGIHCMSEAYEFTMDDIGVMTQKYPKVQENGGIYLHASAFKLVADCLLKRYEQVENGMSKMLPFDDTFHQLDCEPYVFCNCYYSTPGYRYGTAGQSWGTGTASWFYLALLRHIYGLQPHPDGLRLDPCLPPAWKECSIIHRLRGTEYTVTYHQEGSGGKIAGIRLDGRECKEELLPYRPGEKILVEVTLK